LIKLYDGKKVIAEGPMPKLLKDKTHIILHYDGEFFIKGRNNKWNKAYFAHLKSEDDDGEEEPYYKKKGESSQEQEEQHQDEG